MQACTPSSSTWSRKWRPTTRLPMRRPSPSANTVRTVSTSPVRIRDSRAPGSPRSSATGPPPRGVTASRRQGYGAKAPQSYRGTGAEARHLARPRAVGSALLAEDLDRNGRDEHDEQDQAEGTHRVPPGRQRREVAKRRHGVD